MASGGRPPGGMSLGDPDGPSPPAPVVDAVECWLPGDEQLLNEELADEADQWRTKLSPKAASKKQQLLGEAKQLFPNKRSWAMTRSTCEDSCGDGSMPRGSWDSSHPALVAQLLQDLLYQHRAELGHDIEDKLATHWDHMSKRLSQNEELVQRLTEATLRIQGQGHKLQFFGVSDYGHSRSASEVTPHTPPGQEEDKAKSTSVQHAVTFEATELMKRTFSGNLMENQASMRSSLKVPKVDKELLVSLREGCQTVLQSNVCEAILCFFIVCNCCYVGLEVQCTRGVPDDLIPMEFKALEYFFTILFTIELFVRLFAYGWREFFFGDHHQWNLIDTSLVATSILTTAMDLIFSYNPNFEYVRIVRMARTVRILRIVRIVKFFRPLRIIVYSVMNTMRSLGWMLILMLIIIYLFAVTFTYAATWDGNKEKTQSMDPELKAKVDEHFGSLWSAILCLYKASTGGMDWSEASDPLGAIDPLWALFFLAYIAIYNLAILNVITGVVCQTAIESARQDQDIVVSAQMAVKQRYISQLQDLFGQFNTDQQGKITLKEFESRLQDAELQHYFEVLELTIDEAWNLFKLLDNSNAGTIDVEEFVSGCLKLRGNARSIDMHMLMYQSKWTMDRLAAQTTALDNLTEQIESLSRKANSPAHGHPERRTKQGQESARLSTAARGPS